MKLSWLLAGALVAVGCGGENDTNGGGLSSRDGGRSDAGRKDGGSGGQQGVCGQHNVITDRAVPDMLIVLDRSGSMAANGNDNHTDRWGGSAKAVQELTAKYSTGVNFGLMTFPGNNVDLANIGSDLSSIINSALGANCAPGAVNVDIGTDKGPAINQAISRMRPGGYTPTAATLTAAAKVIGSPTYSDSNKGMTKYVLLVTDGDPNCSPNWTPRNMNDVDPQARMDTITAVEKLTDQGVKTYVVGYETAGTAFAGALDMMAAAGGTGETMHRSVKSSDELSATFDEIAVRSTTCTYTLSDKVDPVYVSVNVNGKQRGYNNQGDGWSLDNGGTTVTLLGKACDDVKNNGAFVVTVECAPVNFF